MRDFYLGIMDIFAIHQNFSSHQNLRDIFSIEDLTTSVLQLSQGEENEI